MIRASTEKRYVLGFDGGGTKSIAVVADETGAVLGVGLSKATNFQGIGVKAAGDELKAAIDNAVRDSGVDREKIQCAAYGIAGADRDKDFDIVASYVLPHNPAGRMLLANDTTIALRAGTTAGVGLALICGTGTNCIGFNEAKEQAKVGGLGDLTGDKGYGEEIVYSAIVQAMQSLDGRAGKTMLLPALEEAFGVERLEDIIERWYADSYNPPDIGAFAPIIFDCAKRGDKAARKLLEKRGKVLAKNATVCAKRLFQKDARFNVVLGGSILQKANPPVYVDAVKAAFAKHFPNAKVVRLKIEPVLGALFFALDMLHGKAGRDRMARAKNTYKTKAVR